MPPFLLIHGTKDEDVPYEQSVEMREKARTAGGHCDVIPVDGAPHGMDHWESRAELLWYKKARTDWLKKMVKWGLRSEEHTSELQSHSDLVCRLLLEKKKTKISNRKAR